MALAPPPLAEKAILASSSRIKRHCDIYESDGTTLWEAGVGKVRLIDMSVSVDYGRDERRSLDLTLDNSDGVLRHDPEGFWYDKVLKVYQGVEYEDTTPVSTTTTRINLCINPAVAVSTAGWGYATSRVRQAGGWAAGVVATLTTWLIAPLGTVVVGSMYSGRITVNGPVGRSVILTMDSGSGTNRMTDDQLVILTGKPQEISMLATTSAETNVVRIYASVQPGWAAGELLTMTKAVYEKVSALGVPAGAFFDGNRTNTPNITFSWNGTANSSTSTQVVTGVKASLVVRTWETQIGEFVIDRLDETNFPPSVKVTARDYTKRCLLSKFAQATAFTATAKIEDVIRSIAQNAGISKFLLAVTGKVTGKDFLFERGTERWAAMKEIATAFNYDLYFDAQGYLVMTEYRDPVYAPIVYTLLTGPFEGNLVSYSKSTNDSRLYNHIIVTGESSDSTVVPVSGEATNTLESSPSRIARLGDRVNQFTNSFVTTNAQAQLIAQSFLSVSALEEYDINFSSIAFPWLEVGQIIEFIDPNAGPTDPIRFLLSSLSFTSGLGPMSGNAKRVGIVG